MNWHIPEAAGIYVWPNVSSTRDELRSQIRTTMPIINSCTGCVLSFSVSERLHLLSALNKLHFLLAYYIISMIPAGVLRIAIRADFWQLQKERKRSGIGQILTSACCSQQHEHIDIKKAANNHVTTILERCQRPKKVSFFFLLFVTLYFHATSQELLQTHS